MQALAQQEKDYGRRAWTALPIGRTPTANRRPPHTVRTSSNGTRLKQHGDRVVIAMRGRSPQSRVSSLVCTLQVNTSLWPWIMLRSMYLIRRAITKRHYKDTLWEYGPWFHGVICWSVAAVIATCECGISLLGQSFLHILDKILTLYTVSLSLRSVDTRQQCAVSKCLTHIRQSRGHGTLPSGYGTFRKVYASTSSSVTRQVFAALKYMVILSCPDPMILLPKSGASARASACAPSLAISVRSMRLPSMEKRLRREAWTRASGYGTRLTGKFICTPKSSTSVVSCDQSCLPPLVLQEVLGSTAGTHVACRAATDARGHLGHWRLRWLC